jgi:predicted peptidase
MTLDVSEKNPIDKRRIYITSYSMGGYGTWSMIARYPDLFAAASPNCGCGDPETVSKFVHLPLWVVHGDADQTIPVLESRKMIEALREVGSTPEYHELKGVMHDSWSQTYRDSNGMLN